MCGDRWGSTEHCLLHCPRVAPIWKKSRFSVLIKKASGLEIMEVAEVVRKEWGDDEFDLWAIMLWQTWVFLCKLKHLGAENAEPTSEATCLAIWETYQKARPTMEAAHSLGVALGEKKWRAPMRGRLRVDVDALFNPMAGKFGVGVVVRNAHGNLVATLAKPTKPTSNAMMAEVMAVIHGIVLCVELDFAPVEIFTDSFLAARVMADPNEEEHLLPTDCWDIIRTARENFLIGVFHMYRSANAAAHELARKAANYSQSTCWTANFPSWLRDIVSVDIR